MNYNNTDEADEDVKSDQITTLMKLMKLITLIAGGLLMKMSNQITTLMYELQ